MAETSCHDVWQAGDSYEVYMGRWSRLLAPRFLDWLSVAHGLDWLEVGCGSGALSAAILEGCNPKSLISIDSSEGFVAAARAGMGHAGAWEPDGRADFRVGDALALDMEPASRDVVASALVLNFLPDRGKALTEMRRVVRPGGLVAFYVWDYPNRGVEFVRAFWEAAVALDPGARELAENRRFPYCTPDGLAGMAAAAGLTQVTIAPVEVPTLFGDFEDLWRPFTLGNGPAPGYCANLDATARQRLREKLDNSLPRRGDGTIPLKARAIAVRAVAP